MGTYGCVSVKEEILTVSPLLIVVVGKTISKLEEVPTVQSMTAVPPPEAIRAQVAVPVLPAVPEVIVLAVATPLTDAPKEVDENVSVAKRVWPERAVSGPAGCVPV